MHALRTITRISTRNRGHVFYQQQYTSICHFSTLLSCLSSCPSTSTPHSSFYRISLSSSSSSSCHHRTFATLGGVTVIDLGMPALSPTMEKGNVAAWKIAVGDRIKPGESICTIETDKATVDFEAQEDGYLAAIYSANGTQDVPVGKAIGIMVEEKDDVAKVQAALKAAPQAAAASTTAPAAKPAAPKPASTPAAPTTTSTPASTPTPKATPAPTSTSTSSSPSTSSHSTSASPVHPPSVLHLLHNHHLDASSITATGKDGRLTKGDVLSAIAKGTAKKATTTTATATSKPTATAAATPASTSSPTGRLRDNRTYVDTPTTQMRKVIASRLAQSKSTIPHAYATADVVMDALLKLRASLKASGSPVPSVNDFIIRASALSLRDHPSVARFWDVRSDDIKSSTSIDISVAVATDAGLITPIVKKADTKRIGEISTIVKDLALRARQNKLKPDEFMGGAFTISNLGMFGIDQFSAVINPPQACILAVGGSSSRVRPVATPASSSSSSSSSPSSSSSSSPASSSSPSSLQLDTVSIMSVTLSCDGRVVDAEQAGTWLTSFTRYLEQPTLMLQ